MISSQTGFIWAGIIFVIIVWIVAGFNIWFSFYYSPNYNPGAMQSTTTSSNEPSYGSAWLFWSNIFLIIIAFIYLIILLISWRAAIKYHKDSYPSKKEAAENEFTCL